MLFLVMLISSLEKENKVTRIISLKCLIQTNNKVKNSNQLETYSKHLGKPFQKHHENLGIIWRSEL